MTEKVKVVKVTHFTKNKDGGVLVNRNGDPYTRCLINAEDGRTLSGFGSDDTRSIKIGEEVELEIEQNGKYYNFKLPKTNTGDLKAKIENLEKKISENAERISQLENII